MAAFSSLRFSSAPRLLANFLWRCPSSTARSSLPTVPPTSGTLIATRGMSGGGGHKRVLHITPSRFQWTKFKDGLHFYVMLGAIPLTALVFLVNVFVGPAELAEIPDGYVPKPWEYYDHPIKRFFARYWYPSHQQEYEKYLHYIKEESDKQRLRQLEKKVRAQMSQRGDDSAWYYIPFSAKYVRQHRRETDEIVEASGDP